MQFVVRLSPSMMHSGEEWANVLSQLDIDASVAEKVDNVMLTVSVVSINNFPS